MLANVMSTTVHVPCPSGQTRAGGPAEIVPVRAAAVAAQEFDLAVALSANATAFSPGGVDRSQWGVGDWREWMVSAVEVITAALAAGAGAGLKDTASTAVGDAYAALKELLKRRVGDRGNAAVRALDADETEASVWQDRIGDALAESGAAADEEVLAVARRLLALADPDRARTFHIDVGTNFGAIGDFRAPVTFNQGPPIPPAPPAVP
jgi:hypothetical protein